MPFGIQNAPRFSYLKALVPLRRNPNAGLRSWGTSPHSLRLHQERRCSVSTRRPATKAPEDRHSRTLSIRLTPAEHADAVVVAEALGISVARLMRSRAEALPPNRADKELATELVRIGVNINQIAHAINAGTQPQLAELVPVLDGLNASIEELRSQLRRRE